MSGPLSFQKHEHLRSKKDFDRLFERRCSVSDELLILYAFPNGLDYSRVGFGVSKKVGSAVVRNRFRRIYREAYRLSRSELPVGLDLMMLPRSAVEPTLAAVKSSLRKLASQVQKKLQR